MLKRDVLQQITLGNPVAEFDQGLSNYFLITDTFNQLVRGNVDMITGGKGTGKTAIYQYLQQCKNSHNELRNIQIIAGVNPTGEPLFRRFSEEEKLTEGQYVTIWKLYFLSLIFNWVIKNHQKPASKNFYQLESLLSNIGLLSHDGSAGSVFPRLMGWVRDYARPKSVGMDITINEFGFPVYSPKVEFGETETRQKENSNEVTISHRHAYELLESVLNDNNLTVWVVMDRLDESFIGRPDIEIPALRALIRSFMDIIEYPHIRIKLFVRTDLFRKITQGGFVNLTHVNARKTDITWDDEDLMALICQRIRNNHELLRTLGLGRVHSTRLFSILFPNKMDPKRGQLTWNWMLTQIRDGSGIKAPRNLIDLCILAQEEQLRKERRSSSDFEIGFPLIEADSIKKASVRLSKLRLEDTLLAEYAQDIKVLINAFRNRKAEHNDHSLANLFHVEVEQARLYARALVDIGFFESVGDTYKIPFLYRASLDITQGKAFINNKQTSKK
ncbi:MAG: hypothetical protein RBS07_18700 [Lentimicrobium sp.]|jgi:hypothetical protein|nr:hypothetical protein [Lentimicrobium sp.]